MMRRERGAHRTGRYTKRPKGVSMLVFILIIVPAFFFGVGVAIDLSGLLTQADYNRNVAQAAAQAGATARDLSTGGLDQGEATRRAQLVCAQSLPVNSDGSGRSCSAIEFPSATRVTVTVNARPVFLFANVLTFLSDSGFRHLFSDGGTQGFEDSIASGFAVSSTADVCSSLNSSSSNSAYCVRPQQ